MGLPPLGGMATLVVFRGSFASRPTLMKATNSSSVLPATNSLVVKFFPRFGTPSPVGPWQAEQVCVNKGWPTLASPREASARPCWVWAGVAADRLTLVGSTTTCCTVAGLTWVIYTMAAAISINRRAKIEGRYILLLSWFVWFSFVTVLLTPLRMGQAGDLSYGCISGWCEYRHGSTALLDDTRLREACVQFRRSLRSIP